MKRQMPRLALRSQKRTLDLHLEIKGASARYHLEPVRCRQRSLDVYGPQAIHGHCNGWQP